MTVNTQKLRELLKQKEEGWPFGVNEKLAWAVPDLLDEIDALRAELQARQWISVEDRLPEIDYTKPRHAWVVHVIACWGSSPGCVAEMAYRANGYAKTERGSKPRFEWQGRISPWKVTHWKPKPLPPAPPQGDGA